MKPTVIDLFCGCGGLSYGFIEAGYDVVLGIDHWQDAIKTFEYNHEGSKGLVADLFNETPKEISKKTGIKKADIIIGGPPCQAYSMAGRGKLRSLGEDRINTKDSRGFLYQDFLRFVFANVYYILYNVTLKNKIYKNSLSLIVERIFIFIL